jgi:hypothetical protein
VDVKVEMVSAFDPTSKPHGGDEGPARLDLVRTNGKWEAKIRIHEMVQRTDISRIAEHEIDEIIEIVHTADPAVADDAATSYAESQMQAEVFRPGASSGKSPTAHDRAAARELATAVNDLAAARAAKNKNKISMLERRVEAMKRSMGLADPQGARERADALAKMHLLSPEAGLQVRAEAEAARAAARPGGATRTLSTERIRHILEPEPPATAAKFESDGIAGGHVDSELHAALASRPDIKLTKVAEKTEAGHTYRAYTQEIVDSKGTTMAMDGVAPLYKTTVDDPSALLDNGLEAFDAWATANPGATGNVEWNGVDSRGITFAGYATWDGTTWEILTIYPDAAWIRT